MARFAPSVAYLRRTGRGLEKGKRFMATKITRRFSPDVLQRRAKILVAAPLLLLGAMFMQSRIDPQVKELHKDETDFAQASGDLNNEFLLLPLLGFREAAAGLLWVRCDEFFHSGDYDAILPLVRMITKLDPHADNVYVTGAWHLAYNFTDSSERSDRRYIAPSQALLDEGIRNNPAIPDIKFEKGWQNFDKIKDYTTAAKAFQMAIAGPKGDEKSVSKDSDDYPYAAPLKTLHVLAHTYIRMGRIPDAIAEWDRALARSETELKKKPDDYSLKQMHSAEKHNREETLQRYYDRYTSLPHSPNFKSANGQPDYPFIYHQVKGKPRPFDLAFKTHIDVVRPKVFKIGGQFNGADGARVDLRVTDWDYKERPIGMTLNTFDVDSGQTILVDALSERKNKFEREIDMSKDPKMYSFTGEYYRITLSYNTRTSSPHLQDRYGWSGEGLTDANPAHVIYDRREGQMATKAIEGEGGEGAVWDGKTLPWPQYGQPLRMVKVTYKVSRDQVEGRKPITDADIVANEPIADTVANR